MGKAIKALKLPWLPSKPGSYVLQVETCTECGGSGCVFNERWREVDRLMAEEGFTVTQACRVVFGTDDWAEIPLEEETCSKCDGEGIVYRWIRLDLLLGEQPGQGQAEGQAVQDYCPR